MQFDSCNLDDSSGSQFNFPRVCDSLGAFNTSVGVKQSPVCDICLISATLSVTKRPPGRAPSSIDS